MSRLFLYARRFWRVRWTRLVRIRLWHLRSTVGVGRTFVVINSRIIWDNLVSLGRFQSKQLLQHRLSERFLVECSCFESFSLPARSCSRALKRRCRTGGVRQFADARRCPPRRRRTAPTTATWTTTTTRPSPGGRAACAGAPRARPPAPTAPRCRPAGPSTRSGGRTRRRRPAPRVPRRPCRCRCRYIASAHTFLTSMMRAPLPQIPDRVSTTAWVGSLIYTPAEDPEFNISLPKTPTSPYFLGVAWHALMHGDWNARNQTHFNDVSSPQLV